MTSKVLTSKESALNKLGRFNICMNGYAHSNEYLKELYK